MKVENLAHGTAGRKVEAKVRKKYSRYVRFVDRAIGIAQLVLGEAQINPGEKQKLVCAALLGRLTLATQAGALSAIRGLEHDAMISVRISLELLATLKNCVESSGFVDRYLKADLVRKLKIARGGLQLSGKSSSEIAEFRRLEAYWERLVDEYGAEELKFEQVCAKAGMSDHYNTVYRLTSHAVHGAARLLDDLAVTKGERVSGLDFGPKTQRVPLNLFSLAEFSLMGSDYFASLVGVDGGRMIRRLHSDMKKHAPEWS